MNKNLKQQSNPFSTGGGGVNFETRIQAAFIISMLTQSSVPALSSQMRIKEIKFQNKYAGSEIDDVVLLAQDQWGNQGKLYAQIKHEITISNSIDSIFAEVVQSAWHTFKADNFNREQDVITLITGPISKHDINHTLPILEWAKYSSNAEDFFSKVATDGFSSKTKQERLNIFINLLTYFNEGCRPDNATLWRFLTRFRIISYDLDSEHSIVANLLLILIQSYSTENPSLIFSKVITVAQEFNQNAGIITHDTIPQDLKQLFKKDNDASIERDIKKLRERSNHIFDGILNTIGDLHLPRLQELHKIEEACTDNSVIFVTGARGVGKSSIVKDFILRKDSEIPFFYLRAEDLDKSHLNDVFTAMGMQSTLQEIAGYFALIPEKVLVIESLEKVLELNSDKAFMDLLHYINTQSGWMIIATGREYAQQPLQFNYFQVCNIQAAMIEVDVFNENEIKQVFEHFPQLISLNNNSELRNLLKNPFYLSIGIRGINNGAIFNSTDTENDFRNIIWRTVIANEAIRKNGMPIKRSKTFIEIAKARAKKMVFAISERDFNPEVIDQLEVDHLIYKDKNSGLISPMHDVLEDWALEEFIQDEYRESNHDIPYFISRIGNEPAITRAYRLWLNHQLKSNESLIEFIELMLMSDDVESHWKDETITAILQSNQSNHFLSKLKAQLFSNDCMLLMRFIFILKITCQRPDKYTQNNSLQNEKVDLSWLFFLQPYGKGWDSLIYFIYENRNDLSEQSINLIIDLVDTWCSLVHIDKELPKISRTVGLLALWLLEPIKDSYRYRSQRTKILNTLIKVSSTIAPAFLELMNQDVFITKRDHSGRLSYVDEFVNLALIGMNVPMLCKRQPDFVIKLAWHEWLQEEVKEDEWSRFGYGYGDAIESFGLDRKVGDFFSASGAKGPFQYLLLFHPRKGLDFILQLCNTTADSYSKSEFAQADEDEGNSLMPYELVAQETMVILNDGTEVKQYYSPHLWKGYRGLSTLPYLLQCALMALENFLISYVEQQDKRSVEWIFDYLLRNSNSVMITSVLASIAVGFPKKVGKAAYPLLRNKHFYSLDLQRSVGEFPLGYARGFSEDSLVHIYVKEREQAAQRSWRKEILEELLVKLQFSDECSEEVMNIIDKLYLEAEDNKSLKYLLHRTDSRNFQETVDKNNNRIVQTYKPLPKELEEDQQIHQEEFKYSNQVSLLFVWAEKLYDQKNVKKESFSSYGMAIESAQQLLLALNNNELGKFAFMAPKAILLTAVVSVRDVLNDLSKYNQQWCFDCIVNTILTHELKRMDFHNYDQTDYWGIGACASVIPKLLDLELDKKQAKNLKQAIVLALIQENQIISSSAARGIRDYLWDRDWRFANACLAGAVEYAHFYKKNIELRRYYYLEENKKRSAIKKWCKLNEKFRENILNDKYHLDIKGISLEYYASRLIHLPLLMIPLNPEDTLHVDLFKKITNFIYDSEYHNFPQEDDKYIPHELIRLVQECFGEHLIYSKENKFEPFKDLIVDGLNKAPRFIYMVILAFHIQMETREDFVSFWLPWKLLENEMHNMALTDIHASYTGHQNDLNRFLRDMLYSGVTGEGHPNQKIIVEHGKNYLLDFARKSGSHSIVYESLASLTYYFYELFFEEAIIILAEKFRENPEIITKQINTTFYLEMILGRYLQIENREHLSRKMYDICFDLLHSIVETGSARAYYLRENLIRSRRIK